MKKNKLLILFIILTFTIKTNVYAASANLSVSSTSVTVGSSFTVSVNVNAVAAWNIHVASSGPVSGCSIVQADATADALNTNKTFTATCTATNTGTINISMSGDVTAEDGTNSNISGAKTVIVTNPAPSPSPSTKPTPAPQQTQQPQQPQNQNQEQKSNNTNLKNISVDKYDLETTDNVNYTLTVKNSITVVKVNAEVEDSKSKVEGTGNVNLKIGENKVELKVTAEDRTTKIYTITITRKDSTYTLKDIDDAIEENKSPIIKLDDNDIITTDILEKIKNSKKVITFTKTDDNNNELYSYIIDGSKLSKLEEINTYISYTIEGKDDFDELIGYRNGIYINTNNSKGIIKPTILKIYVGDKYKDDEKIYVYYYDKNKKKIELIESEIIVKDGMIELSATKGANFFISKASLEEAKQTFNIYKLITVIEFYIIVIITLLLSIKKLKNKKQSKE